MLRRCLLDLCRGAANRMGDQFDEIDIMLISLLLQILSLAVDNLTDQLDCLLSSHLREQRRLNGSLPMNKTRVSFFSWVEKKTKPKFFRRMFRMPLESFNLLCDRIKEKVGEDAFQPENKLFQSDAVDWKVPPIQGEVKVAVSLRLLAGGSYLDLIPMFDMSGYIYVVFSQFLDWILDTMSFPLVGWLIDRNWTVLHHLARQFAEKSNEKQCSVLWSICFP